MRYHVYQWYTNFAVSIKTYNRHMLESIIFIFIALFRYIHIGPIIFK